MSPRRLLAALLVFHLGTAAASARDTNCAALPDQGERAACIERAADAARARLRHDMQPGSPQRRAELADELQRMFLSNGINLDVFRPENLSQDNKTHVPFKKYPKLIIFGYLRKSDIYLILTKAHVLEHARERGFKGVEFYSTASLSGDGGFWFWDLSGPAIPQCAVNNRLCL